MYIDLPTLKLRECQHRHILFTNKVYEYIYFKMFKFLVIFAIVFQCKFIKSSTQNPDNAEELFKRLFKHRRFEQLEAVKSLLKLSSYDQKYSMVMLMAEKIFASMQENRAQLESSNYIPGVSQFPVDDTTKFSLSNILENTALFSEVILRLPEISQQVLKSNNNWDVLLQWSIAFANQVKYLIDESTIKLLHLVSQEMNHTERDPSYINPYRKEQLAKKIQYGEKILVKKKERKKIKKGPRFTEL